MSSKSKSRKQSRERFDLSDIEPIKLDVADGDDNGSDDDDAVEQIHVFSIGDTDYYMPVQVDYVHSIRAMEIQAQRGEAASVAYMLRVTLGDEAYEALINYPKLREEHFEQIMATANKIVMASREGKARSLPGSLRSAG